MPNFTFKTVARMVQATIRLRDPNRTRSMQQPPQMRSVGTTVCLALRWRNIARNNAIERRLRESRQRCPPSSALTRPSSIFNNAANNFCDFPVPRLRIISPTIQCIACSCSNNVLVGSVRTRSEDPLLCFDCELTVMPPTVQPCFECSSRTFQHDAEIYEDEGTPVD